MNEELLRHIDRLIAQRPASRSALIRYRILACLMQDIKPKTISLSEQKIHRGMRNKEDFPLFAGQQDLPLDYETAETLLKRFLETLRRTGRKDEDGIKKFAQKAGQDHCWVRELYGAVLGKDNTRLTTMAAEVDLDPSVLLFLTKVSLRPCFQALREAVKEILNKSAWGHGICPLCGSPPDMAFLAATGRGFLHCSLCGEAWPYPRIKCPFCENEDRRNLGFLGVEGEEGFGVYFCRKCLCYLKTLDMRAFEETAPFDIEYLATLHLDILAPEKGFE